MKSNPNFTKESLSYLSKYVVSKFDTLKSLNLVFKDKTLKTLSDTLNQFINAQSLSELNFDFSTFFIYIN